MRLLILSVSALSLGACTMGGVGYGAGHSGYETSAAVGHGSWQNSHSGGDVQSDAYGYGAPQGPYQGYDQGQYQNAQHQGHGYAAPSYSPAPSPCQQAYQPPVVQSPCAAAQPYAPPQQQPVDYAAQYMSSQAISYPSGYPTGPAPTPTQYTPAPAAPCGFNPCASSYSVNPYGNDADYGAHDNVYGGYGYQSTGYAPQAHNGYGQAYHSKPTALRGSKEPYLYASLGYGTNRVVNTTLDTNDSFGTSVIGRLGISSASWYGAEIELAKGVSKSELAPLTESGIDTQAAVFGVARLPITRSKRARLLGRVGYHVTGVETDMAGVSTSENEDGVALGIGFEYDVTPKSTIRLDSTGYALNDDTATGTAAISYQLRF